MLFLYQASDVFLNLSTEEAFGQTMLEAAACELPIVAFDAGGVPEIARNGINAQIAEVGDVERVCELLREMCGDPEKRESLGRAGRKIVLAEFSLQRQAENWTAYMKKLAGANE